MTACTLTRRVRFSSYSDSRKNNTDFALLHIFNLLGGCNILTYFLLKKKPKKPKYNFINVLFPKYSHLTG